MVEWLVFLELRIMLDPAVWPTSCTYLYPQGDLRGYGPLGKRNGILVHELINVSMQRLGEADVTAIHCPKLDFYPFGNVLVRRTSKGNLRDRCEPRDG